MCSLNDGDLLLLKNDDTIKLDDCFCLKCKTEKSTVKLRGTDVYCNSCFLTSVTHKFRATLGKSKLVKRTDKILVGYSGKSASVALLNLIKAGMHESVHKRLVFETHVIHIDDGYLLNKTIQQRQSTINEIIKQTNLLDFKLYVISIGNILLNDNDLKLHEINNYNCSIDDNDNNLLNIYNNLNDTTSKIDFLHKIKEKLIVKVAKYFNCCKIFFDNDSTSLAVTILSNVSLGRGAQLSSDVGFVDERYNDIMILRPMRDFTRQELNYYMNIHNLNSLTINNNDNLYSSIQSITENFVINLDDQFGGTVAAIFRTGEKLSTKSKNNNIDIDKCVMCEGFIDTCHFDNTTSAIEATNFSKIVSSKGSLVEYDLSIINNDKKCNDCSGNCHNKNDNDITIDDINKHLCYACRRIFDNEKIINNYLTNIINKIREKKAFENMKNEISDFLLE